MNSMTLRGLTDGSFSCTACGHTFAAEWDDWCGAYVPDLDPTTDGYRCECGATITDADVLEAAEASRRDDACGCEVCA